MFSNPATQAAIISGVISFLFGGGLIAFLKYYRDGKAENRSFAETEREKMRAEIERLNQSVSAMSARLVPSNLPTWIKDSDFKYIDVNPAWEIQVGTRIGKFRHDVIGKNDFEVFADFPEFADMISSIDKEAATLGGVAVRTGVVFPKAAGKRIIIKEIVINDILGNPVFKGMAVPEGS